MTLQEFMQQRDAQATLSWEYGDKVWSHEIRMHKSTAQFMLDGNWVDEVYDAYRDCTNVTVTQH